MNPISALFDRYGDRSIAAEKAWVTEGHDSRRNRYVGVAWRGLLGMAAVFGVSALHDSAWSVLPSLVLGLAVGHMAMHRFVKASAYRSGWLDGRHRMVQQLGNHESIDDWLRTEFDHDSVHVMGMPPLPPRSSD